MKTILIAVGAALAVLVAVTFWKSPGQGLPQTVIANHEQMAPPAAWTVEVTYIANAGVLLSSGDTRVLIDGLFRPYDNYPALPLPHREQLESGTAPFDGIDLILVSHIHGDHFDAEAVVRYLLASPGTELISSDQVVDELRQTPEFAAIADRVRGVSPTLGERVPVTAAGIQIDVLGVGHGSGRHREIQNLGHVVTLGGRTFLHVGDADPTSGILERFNLATNGIDVAFLPAWFLTESPDLVHDDIRPRHVAAVHMPPIDLVGPERFLSRFSDAVLFTRLLERRYY